MGIGFHELCFLRYSRKHGDFGSVATLGRQEVHLPADYIERILGIDLEKYSFGEYCERLLIRAFGAKAVDSFDASSYEGACIIWDFNDPVVVTKQYDTVLDLGSSEHIFNVA